MLPLVRYLCYGRAMTTSLTLVGGTDHETRNESIVRRIKEQMGGQDVTKLGLAEMTGINRVTIGRRLSMATDFTVVELENIAEALRVSFDWLVTGQNPRPDTDPDGGLRYAVGGSNPGPAGSELRRKRPRLTIVSDAA